MQSKNPFLDDLSKLMTNAFGVAQNAKGEMETAMKSMLDRWLVDRNLATNEELEAVKLLVQKVSDDNKILQEKVNKFEKYLNAEKKSKVKKT
jgi:hypothetical protein